MQVKRMGITMMAVLVLLLGQAPTAVAMDQVNVNTATIEQLQTVKHIGPKIAAAILAYREAHGDFRSLDELTAVKGIGTKTLEKIRPYLTVGPAGP